MDISVIVPIYNVEKYIERCLRSLFSQTKIGGVEFILVNDATPDGSMDIVSRLIKEYSFLDIKVLNKEVNEGLASARKSGIELAIGEYIMHIDSDDWCESTMLEDLYNKAKEDDADIVGSDFYFYEKDDEVVYKENPLPTSNIECLQLLLLYDDKVWPAIWQKMIKNNLYRDNNLVDFHPVGINYSEDLITSTKLFFFAKKIVYLPKAYVHYTYNKNSVSRRFIDAKIRKELYLAKSNVNIFLSERIYDTQVLEALNCMKIKEKMKLVYNTRGEEQRFYSKVWPEIDKFILKQSGRLYTNFAIWLASQGFICGCNFILSSKKLVRKVKQAIESLQNT